MKQEISLGSKFHKILQKEFSHVSRQTIHTALKYFNNSEVAQEIRARALELIEDDLKVNKAMSKEMSELPD